MIKISYLTFLQKAKIVNSNEQVNKIILAKILNQNLNWLYANFNSFGTETELNHYLQLIKQYADGYPLGYIIGYVNFYHCHILVNPNVLVPRNETEQLVDRVIQLSRQIFKKQKIRILDLATGSGCIAIALAKQNPNWKVWASDISQSALLVAQQNLNLNQVNNLFLKQSNLFENLKGQKFHIIVANPPYIDCENEIYEKQQLQHEPKIALFAKDNGLYFYQSILKTIHLYCEKTFLIAFEIGNQQMTSITKMLQILGWNKFQFWFEKDFQNQWRFLFIKNDILS